MVEVVIRVSDSLTIATHELEFHTSRSGGPGGQNVNKLETRVELLFDVAHSRSLTEEQREILSTGLRSKLDANGVLRVVSQESRSQWLNKQHAIEKLVSLLRTALKPRKKRVATTPHRAAREKRLQAKKIKGEKKKLRKKTYE